MRPKETRIETLGAAIRSFYDGLGSFTSIAAKYLLQYKLAKPDANKQAVLDIEAWFPQEDVLGAYHAINREIGDGPTFKTGYSIPKYAVWPPFVTDVHSALQSVDIAYHMNHRKDGVVMFDPQTGKMLEGIGHYLYQAGTSPNAATIICDDPFPCEFDRGIITATAARYQARATAKHAPNTPCRKDGAEKCVYYVAW